MRYPDLTRRAQVPRWIERLDDPWGITWRAANAVRRFNARRLARLAWGLARGVRYARPVFVLGVPRSGTTLLFQLLRESSVLGALPGEGHDIWRAYHHPRWHGWRSDAVGTGELGPGERRFVAASFYARLGSAHRRFVEKTPENCLRIPYLLELFPDAVFVVVHRNPLAVLNSLVNGWRHPEGRYRSYYVPEDLAIPGYAPRRRWCFALVEGWRALRSASVPEIAFAQWRECLQGLLAGRELVPRARWLELRLEQLLAAPEEVARAIYAHAGIPDEPALGRKLAELVARPVNALSPANPDAWRDENRKELLPLVPRVVPLAAAVGYYVDPRDGSVVLA